jgi:hypothetical protein
MFIRITKRQRTILWHLLDAEKNRLNAMDDTERTKRWIPPKTYRDDKRKEVVLMLKKLKRG